MTIAGLIVNVETVQVVLLNGIADGICIGLHAFHKVTPSFFFNPVFLRFLSRRSHLVAQVLYNPAQQRFSALDFLKELQVFFLFFRKVSTRTPQGYEVHAIGQHLQVVLRIAASSGPVAEPAESLHMRRLTVFSQFDKIVTHGGSQVGFTFRLQQGNVFFQVLLVFERFSFRHGPFGTGHEACRQQQGSCISYDSFHHFICLTFP